MKIIKKKLKMNLADLVEWGWEHEIKNKQYFCNENNSKSLTFNSYGNVEFSNFYPYLPIDTFSVEIEEEITEDTKLFLISRCIGKLGNVSYLYDRTTINRRLDNLPGDCKITHFYIENEDKELVLIWKNGELVKY
ncbi:hypothetical protein ACFP67_14045 [Mammaliicoccus sciuri]|uniref:hypothetical protein n=1 Tax=Mammaliicoccus sciuri TaxID=1296 RepID=UPI000CD19BBB|nr:hypothetical protein [Mammaliicoccus sciuri]PNZ30009.1 hypothetical protein CD114_01265 [Mammaliicoccus sciuri]